jgi:hypothetical protein
MEQNTALSDAEKIKDFSTNLLVHNQSPTKHNTNTL